MSGTRCQHREGGNTEGQSLHLTGAADRRKQLSLAGKLDVRPVALDESRFQLFHSDWDCSPFSTVDHRVCALSDRRLAGIQLEFGGVKLGWKDETS